LEECLAYLKQSLSEEQHGGIYRVSDFNGSGVAYHGGSDKADPYILVWAVDKTGIKSIIDNYAEQKVEIIQKDADYSLQQLNSIMDEAANIGQIPRLEKLMATIRSREISACLVLQAQSQLKALYKDNADTIVGNCDSSIFLGGREKTTLEDWSKLLGKETIDSFNNSETKGQSPSYGRNFQKLGKDVLSCKGVESTAPIKQGSSAICGTSGRAAAISFLLNGQGFCSLFRLHLEKHRLRAVIAKPLLLRQLRCGLQFFFQPVGIVLNIYPEGGGEVLYRYGNVKVL
jgi:hypothetical protein